MDIIEKILQVVDHTSEFLLKESSKFTKKDIEIKSKNSLVTYVDKQAEKILIQGLSDLFPEAAYYTEEETISRDTTKEYTWIIDPLDGTTNYLHDIPHYSISVALKKNDEIIYGVVKECDRDRSYYAIKGEGAYLDGKRIYISETSSISEAIIATGFPYEGQERIEKSIQLLSHWVHKARGVRRFGSAALDLAYVASGRFDVFYESTLNPWDVAAGYLLVKEAGGSVTTFSGHGSPIWDGEIIASNKELSEEVRKIITSAMRG